MSVRKVVSVVGARPNFMKVAPIHRALEEHPAFDSLVVHTGQHHDDAMSAQFFRDLGLPEPNLHLQAPRTPLESFVGHVIGQLGTWLRSEAADFLVVVGDVHSTVAAAMAGRAVGVPIAHVEAGLRSGDRDMPEETNRILVDQIADLHFVTEPSGMENLAREGLPNESRFLVGNTMIDSLVFAKPKIEASNALLNLGLTGKEFAVATFHRPSNVDSRSNIDRLIRIVESVALVMTLVLPLHPRTRNRLQAMGGLDHLESIPNLKVTEPLGYVDFMRVVSAARVVITDSGGIQEESSYLGIPCLTIRPNTERPITIDRGTNQLLSGDVGEVLEAIRSIQSSSFKIPIIPNWDGLAARRIVEILADGARTNWQNRRAPCHIDCDYLAIPYLN